jgi:hypothetical protein
MPRRHMGHMGMPIRPSLEELIIEVEVEMVRLHEPHQVRRIDGCRESPERLVDVRCTRPWCTRGVDIFLEALEGAAPGNVLVVDNGGRLDEACVGDLVVLEAQAAGLEGIVIWGCIATPLTYERSGCRSSAWERAMTMACSLCPPPALGTSSRSRKRSATPRAARPNGSAVQVSLRAVRCSLTPTLLGATRCLPGVSAIICEPGAGPLRNSPASHRAFWLNILCAVVRDDSCRRISSFHWRSSVPCCSRLNEFQLG